MTAPLAPPAHIPTHDARPLVLVPRPLGIDDATVVLARAAATLADLDEITRDAIKANA